MEPSIVIKVQYGETLRRFSSRVVDGKLDLDMNALREKVLSLFSFPAGSELAFTYKDEDGDVVTLADEEDLHDILSQSLNPLRITVKLNMDRSISVRSHSRSSGNSTPMGSPLVQPLLQVTSTSVSEILNSLPGTVRETVSKFSTELGFDTNSPAGYIVILDSLAKMGLTYLKEVSVAGAKSGPSESSTDAPVTKDKNSSIAVGTTQISEMKSSDTDQGNAAGFSEGFVMPATHNANAKDKPSFLLENTDPDSFNDSKRHNDIGSEGNNFGNNGRFGHNMKLVKKSYESHPGWKSVMGPKPLIGIDSPFSGPPVPSYVHRRQHIPRVVKRSYNHSDVIGSVLHTGIQCDGCELHPISGPRFKSKVKEDYDLCSNCFADMGSEAEYIRMDLPMNYQSPNPKNFCYPMQHCLGRSPTLPADHSKLDSRFILDVNILDGTIMPPSTLFTKIWRMRNNGAVAWPHGTNLLWIGGEKLSKTLSCDLKIPADGCLVDKEIDIAVDFSAPEHPGRYVSYWRMASPSGHKFGQRVWVLIQVDSSLKGSNSKNRHDFNLNLPPVSSGIMGFQNENASIDHKIGDDLIEIDTPIRDQGVDLPNNESLLVAGAKPNLASPKASFSVTYPAVDLSKVNNETLLVAGAKPNSASPEASSSVTYPAVDLSKVNNETLLVAGAKQNSASPEASSSVKYPAVDLSKVEPIAISVPRNSDMDVPSMIEADQGTDEVEQTLLNKLEDMGFTQVDLNKQILRNNEYDLEQSLNELCSDTEWDPILAELQEMGFSNNEMNKLLLLKNNGSIKRVVMDLIAGEDA